MRGEHLLAFLGPEFREHARSRSQDDVTFVDIRKTEVMQHFSHREQVIHFQVQRARDLRHVGAAMVGRGGERLDQPRHQIGDTAGKPLPKSSPFFVASPVWRAVIFS